MPTRIVSSCRDRTGKTAEAQASFAGWRVFPRRLSWPGLKEVSAVLLHTTAALRASWEWGMCGWGLGHMLPYPVPPWPVRAQPGKEKSLSVFQEGKGRIQGTGASRTIGIVREATTEGRDSQSTS
jgi:hypothetical protein